MRILFYHFSRVKSAIKFKFIFILQNNLWKQFFCICFGKFFFCRIIFVHGFLRKICQHSHSDSNVFHLSSSEWNRMSLSHGYSPNKLQDIFVFFISTVNHLLYAFALYVLIRIFLFIASPAQLELSSNGIIVPVCGLHFK